ncbi:putative thioredoxin [Aspergillus violaceofuscus CBS 115571]|uniref:Thioredoxin n=1 Tax=Aspergillus violaceofuscus (strain CBS 115571) TaxID=1450538 RepID=A0A2V5GY32_ASPV1|nr:putative thioredoxin [Aspergillus violaceofuscus CBS 115571]
MPVTAIQSLAEFREIIAEDKPVIIDFWATWCGPCRMVSPVLEKISNETEKVAFYKVDVDAHDDISQEVSIRAMPTFILFKNGAKVDELVGADQRALAKLVERATLL